MQYGTGQPPSKIFPLKITEFGQFAKNLSIEKFTLLVVSVIALWSSTYTGIEVAASKGN